MLDCLSMKKMLALCAVMFSCVMVFAGCIGPSAQFDEFLDVQYQYIAGVDPSLLSLDVYVPNASAGFVKFSEKIGINQTLTENKKSLLGLSGDELLPVMVWVHGGGWRTGDKSNKLDDKIDLFMEAGWILVSVNYRLSPEDIPLDESEFDPDRIMYPIHNQDVASAVLWVVQNIGEYGGSSENISLMGHSAGAAIVAAVGTNESFLQSVGLDLDVLKSVVCLDTAGYNVTHQIENTSLLVELLYKNAFGLDSEVWCDASPINHVESGKNIPPFFVVTRGSEDRVSVNDNFVSALEGASVDTVLVYAMNYTHAQVNEAIGKPGEQVITPLLIDFLGF